MLQYLVILLDDTSTSYCHYENFYKESRLIPLDTLREGIMFAMKENLMIQFVYPDYELPQEYLELIDSIDHADIKSSNCKYVGADVVVYDDVNNLATDSVEYSISVVLRLSKKQLFDQAAVIANLIGKVKRLNIVITDIESFSNGDFKRYEQLLINWSNKIVELYRKGERPELNLLTDRMVLDSMNNCGAGNSTITLAPDGNFYVCPAFYHVSVDEDYGLGKSKFNIGSLKEGFNIKNPHLYKLDFAPICGDCDAYQCKRCIWLNRKMTYEVNTPSKQQCVIAHIERNASRALLKALQSEINFMKSRTIEKIDYLDPFERITNKKY